MPPTTRQATLISFDPATWTALVQVNGADAAIEMAVGRWVPDGMLAEDDQVGVLLFDETNPEHGLVVGPYGGAPAGVGARVYNSGALSINNDTETSLTFDSEHYDNGGLHSTSSNTGRLTAPVAGRYLIAASVAFNFDVDGYRRVFLRVNGSSSILRHTVMAVTVANIATDISVATLYHLAAGDYVEVRVRHTSGAALNINAAAGISPEFSMHLLP